MTTTQSVLPKDVISELSFFGGGGGGPSPNPCLWYEQPTIFQAPVEPQVAWDIVTIKACGWDYQEKVTVALTKPNGEQIAEELLATEDEWAIEFIYRITLDDPLGRYSVSFTGKKATTTGGFTVGQPDKPTIVFDGKDTMLLSGFAPNERLRLFAYVPVESIARLVAWQEFQTDIFGRLFISFDANMFAVDNFVAIGDVSGEIAAASSVWPHIWPYIESTIRNQ